MKKTGFLILISIALLVASSSCKKDKHICSISLDKTTLDLEVGVKQTLVATVDISGDMADEGLTWSSNDPEVATVSETGEVTALAEGSSIISVSPNADPDRSAVCLVTVVNARPPVMQVALDKTSLKLVANTKAILVATITPADANQSVTWTSSEPTIATVSATGEVSALSDGNATITATSVSDPTKSATCALKVGPIPTGFDNEGEPGIDGLSWATAYEIASVDQLTLLATRINDALIADSWNSKYYVLTAEIDFGAANTAEWMPIGNAKAMNAFFKGHFDGKDFAVKGKLNNPASYKSSFGIFGHVDNGNIKNLHFKGELNFVGQDVTPFIGAIAGAMDGTSTLENCSNHSNINSLGHIGGIVGNISSDECVVSACVNLGTITSTNGAAAGIVSSSSGSVLVGCINKGAAISSSLGNGGITRRASGIVAACWSKVTSLISSQDQPVGTISGIVNPGGKISYCHWLECAFPVTDANDMSRVENSASFTGNAPSASQIASMNTEWASKQADRKFKFNETTGEIEKIQQ